MKTVTCIYAYNFDLLLTNEHDLHADQLSDKTRAQYSDPDKVFSYQDECQKFEFDPMVGEHEYLCSAVGRRLQQYKYYFNIG